MNKALAVETARIRFVTKIEELEAHIQSVQNSANSESKSSMGDKYETGRAMAQNEVFMLSTQLESQRTEFAKFESTDFSTFNEVCSAGSLIKTTSGWFLLSASLGKVQLPEGTMMCISLDSPLARGVVGKKKGDLFTVNGRVVQLLELV